MSKTPPPQDNAPTVLTVISDKVAETTMITTIFLGVATLLLNVFVLPFAVVSYVVCPALMMLLVIQDRMSVFAVFKTVLQSGSQESKRLLLQKIQDVTGEQCPMILVTRTPRAELFKGVTSALKLLTVELKDKGESKGE
jgi:hypothetical protein